MSLEKKLRKRSRAAVCWLATITLLGCVALASEKMANVIIRKGFRVPGETYEAPHETQIKSLLQGEEAEPQENGLVLIREFQLTTFTETGETQMLVLAPQCIFDAQRRSASSSGPVRVRSGDGKLCHEGEGFLWQQTNNVLIISNRVQTTYRGTLTNSIFQ